jgi:phage terminase large subunit GpA-like protein
VSEQQLFENWSELWRPPERLPLSQWAEKHFYLSEYSAKTGQLELRSYQREPLDSFTDPRVSEIVLKCGTQLLKTLFVQAGMAYIACEDPGPTLVSQPKEDDAETFSKERLAPMIRDMPLLRERIAETKSRSSSTTLFKQFPGGSWAIVGAGAPGNAARRSIRYYFADEVNKYEATKEGPFTALAEERTSTFRTRAKRVYVCSPTTPDGEISIRFENSDQRYPWVPCPKCGKLQKLKWAQVQWDSNLPFDDQPESALYKCEHCPALWKDSERQEAGDQHTVWIAEKPFRGIAGFGGLGHLYAPDKKLAQMVRKFLYATKDAKTGNTESLRAFVNTNLAEDWLERGEAPEWQRLYDHREDYPAYIVPRRGLFVTAGADVQKDRIEISVYAWGRGKESWLIDYVVFAGSPELPQVWAMVSEFLNQTYRHESGLDMPIVRFAIDSGHATQQVYNWVRQQHSDTVMAVDGRDVGAAIVGQPKPVDITIAGKTIQRGARIWPVNVSALKHELYGWLRLEKPTDKELDEGGTFPPGYCHFNGQVDDEFFKQLTAEELVTRLVKGYRKQEWVKTRERNEALDTRLYARAAASVYGLDRSQEAHWAQLEAQVFSVEATPTRPSPKPAAEPADPVKKTFDRIEKQSGWMGPRKGWFK